MIIFSRWQSLLSWKLDDWFEWQHCGSSNTIQPGGGGAGDGNDWPGECAKLPLIDAQQVSSWGPESGLSAHPGKLWGLSWVCDEYYFHTVPPSSILVCNLYPHPSSKKTLVSMYLDWVVLNQSASQQSARKSFLANISKLHSLLWTQNCISQNGIWKKPLNLYFFSFLFLSSKEILMSQHRAPVRLCHYATV